MKKSITVLISVMLVSSIFTLAFLPITTGAASTDLPDYIPMESGPEFRILDLELNREILGAPAGASSSGPNSAAATVGDYVVGLLYNNGGYSLTYYICRAVGDYTEIWVQANLAFPAGDPRPTPVITDEQVDYVLNEFESNILQKTTEYFGDPFALDGTNAPLGLMGYGNYYDEEARNIIMVSNVRDENYYDPTYPYYIVGFFSTTYEYYFNRNIITIDSHDWENRLGSDVARPNLYESTIAHEYQHLIHSDYNPGDDSFMNEGCSLFAEPLCGYPIDWGQVLRFLETPDNSLTAWGDQGDINILADYGSSFLWAMYLADHYGASFLRHFVQEGIPGVDGINAALEFFEYEERFDDVFHDWRIANLIHTGDGKYNYKSLDLSDANYPLYIHDMDNQLFKWTQGTDFGTTWTYDGYDTGVSMLGAYGTDYIGYIDETWNKNFGKLYFDGDDTALVNGWEMTDYGWYSGAEDLMNVLLAGEAYVDPVDPTLYLNTYWDIEDYWDFGFVQISTDDGATWTSLENEYTTYEHDAGAHPDVVANLPGLTIWSEDFIDITFDLSAYAGQDVLIGFRYVTDWGTLYEGWYIADANVGGVPLDLAPVYPDASFMVTVVAVKETRHGTQYQIMDLNLNEDNFGSITLMGNWADHMTLIVSATQYQGFADYAFRIKTGKKLLYSA